MLSSTTRVPPPSARWLALPGCAISSVDRLNAGDLLYVERQVAGDTQWQAGAIEGYLCALSTIEVWGWRLDEYIQRDLLQAKEGSKAFISLMDDRGNDALTIYGTSAADDCSHDTLD
jgi:hypothetical protein